MMDVIPAPLRVILGAPLSRPARARLAVLDPAGRPAGRQFFSKPSPAGKLAGQRAQWWPRALKQTACCYNFNLARVPTKQSQLAGQAQG